MYTSNYIRNESTFSIILMNTTNRYITNIFIILLVASNVIGSQNGNY